MDKFPETIKEQNLKAELSNLEKNNWSVFIITAAVPGASTQLPKPVPFTPGAKNYVDTSRPPPGSSHRIVVRSASYRSWTHCWTVTPSAQSCER